MDGDRGSEGPAYIYEEFRAACENRQVVVYASAQRDAGFFNLRTRDKLLGYIAADELDQRAWKNSRPWKDNPNPKNLVLVDAYLFGFGMSTGYLAFFKGPGTWVLKSFKQSQTLRDDGSPATGSQIGQAMMRALQKRNDDEHNN